MHGTSPLPHSHVMFRTVTLFTWKSGTQSSPLRTYEFVMSTPSDIPTLKPSVLGATLYPPHGVVTFTLSINLLRVEGAERVSERCFRDKARMARVGYLVWEQSMCRRGA